MFINSELDLNNLKSPHIIIDMANLFKYSKDGITIKDNNKNYKFKSVYLGYFGDHQKNVVRSEPQYALEIATLPFFKVNDNNSVTTYIDRLIELKYKYNEDIPSDFFHDLLKKIGNEKYKVDDIDEKLLNVLPLLINKIMNENISEQQLKTYIIERLDNI